MNFDTTQQLIDAFRRGQMVVLVDDDDDRQGGVLLAPAETITAEQVNFMARFARGLICLGLTPERCAQLALPPMVSAGANAQVRSFTVSIEAASGISTGISAADRAHTIRTAVARQATPRDLVQPGHIFPLRAEPGGVLKRAGHTEGGCDLARLAGIEPAVVLAEVLGDDGTVTAGARLAEFARAHALPLGSIAGLIQFRLLHETTVQRIREGAVQTAFGVFQLHAFQEAGVPGVHLALVRGDIDATTPTLVRVHVTAVLRDLLSTDVPGQPRNWNPARCLERITREGHGVLVLLNQPQGEQPLLESIEAALGGATPESPRQRSSHQVQSLVGVGSQILRQLGIGRMRLMGPPIRYNALSGFGLEVVEYLAYDGT